MVFSYTRAEYVSEHFLGAGIFGADCPGLSHGKLLTVGADWRRADLLCSLKVSFLDTYTATFFTSLMRGAFSEAKTMKRAEWRSADT